MPLYEYKCDKCGNLIEVEQRMVDDPLTTHEGCGGHLNKVFSSASFHFKGSGFYKTDNRPKKPNVPAKAKPKSDSSTETKTESPKKDSKKPNKSD